MPVPLYDGKYESEPAVTPGAAMADARERGIPRAETPDAVMLCYNPDLLIHLVETYAGEELPGQYFGGACYRLPEVAGPASVGVVGGFGIGAPATAMIVEVLSESGTGTFCVCGRAGVLAPDAVPAENEAGEVGGEDTDGDDTDTRPESVASTVSGGDERVPPEAAVLATSALRDEGTSHHYAPDARTEPADESVREALAAAVESAGIPTREGPTWTTDAIFRETVAEVRHYAEAGVLTVEMEAATAFTVAHHRGARAGAAFVPSDYVTVEGWAPRFGDDVGLLKRTGQAVVEALAGLD
jgi:uridine phosphorylase